MTNQYLQSISLPHGLTTIEARAFAVCARLAAVATPLTLEKVGDYAFQDCVSLERIALRDTITAGEVIFYNCPRLTGYDQWKPVEEDYEFLENDYENFHRFDSVYAFLSPENERDLVPVYQAPSEASKTLGEYACGSTVKVLGKQDGWCHISFYKHKGSYDEAQEGYVRASELSTTQLGETLFEIANVRPRSADVMYQTSGVVVLPLSEKQYALPQGSTLQYPRMKGQWCNAEVVNSIIEDGSLTLDGDYYCYFRPSDLIYTREHTGDNRTLGMVITSDMRDRIDLREQPNDSSQSLGKYFSGMQVEVLGEEGDWYRVRVDFTDGYMLKAFIQIVPQEE